MDEIYNFYIKNTLERARFFQTVQAWPLTEQLDYVGWLGNFTDPSDKEIASHILDFFTYYSSNIVNQMLRASVGKAGYRLLEMYPDWIHEDFIKKCIYSYVPGENPNSTDSGNLFTRKLRDALGIPESIIVDYHEIPNKLTSIKPKAVILVDDFVGSGSQIDKAWNINRLSNGLTLSEMSEGGYTFVYAPLIVNSGGYDRIVSECVGLILSATHVLGSEYCLFNKDCFCWKKSDTLYSRGVELILRKSRELGIPSTNGIDVRDEKGFGMQGLAIAFEHGMPDAVPAFFYWQAANWAPLMRKNYTK